MLRTGLGWRKFLDTAGGPIATERSPPKTGQAAEEGKTTRSSLIKKGQQDGDALQISNPEQKKPEDASQGFSQNAMNLQTEFDEALKHTQEMESSEEMTQFREVLKGLSQREMK